MIKKTNWNSVHQTIDRAIRAPLEPTLISLSNAMRPAP
jgi:hypothetical protein